jgi:hypothetical protein
LYPATCAIEGVAKVAKIAAMQKILVVKDMGAMACCSDAGRSNGHAKS